MLRFDRAETRLGTFALRADFAVPAGARLAVIGPSGSGKSTLLGMIAGFVPLSAGRIEWQGRDLTNTPPGARPVSILFQDQNLFPHLTVAQNVGLGLRPDLRRAPGKNRLSAPDPRRIASSGRDRRAGCVAKLSRNLRGSRACPRPACRGKS